MAQKNGKDKQDSVIAKFKHDINSTIKPAWKSALELGEENKKYREERRRINASKERFIPTAREYNN